MKILGPEGVTYGVEDLEIAEQFWIDFGLTLTEKANDRLDFECADGGTIVVRRIDDPDLPPAVIGGSTGREFVWGVEAESDLVEIAEALSDLDSLIVENDSVRVTDPNGYPLRFRKSRRRPIEVEPTEFNNPNAPTRINKRAEMHSQATPLEMEHLVFRVLAFEETRAFYMDRLQFRMSDCYIGRAWFLRSNGGHAHHNAFFMNRPEEMGFDHVAFVVRNIHEVIGGGLNMMDKGWETRIGPGRHPMSSSYFWYFENPCGGGAEYDWDTDYVTDNWEARELPPGGNTFAEWMLPDGVERFKGFPAGRRPSKSG